MAASKQITFTVEGSAQFPFDMLRYDQCWPKSGIDIVNLDAHNTGRLYDEIRQVTLVTNKSKITPKRWASFGWEVIAEWQQSRS
jgi:hypothetical protein